jgi:hypothetical protein
VFVIKAGVARIAVNFARFAELLKAPLIDLTPLGGWGAGFPPLSRYSPSWAKSEAMSHRFAKD